MKNYVSSGSNIRATLTAAVASGEGVVIGDLFAVAMNDYAANAEGVYLVSGIVSLPKKTGDSFTAGAKVYWDAAVKQITVTAGSSPANTHAGWYIADDGTANVQVRLRL